MYEKPTVTFRTIVFSSLVVVGLVLVMVYIAFQARFLIIGPQIVLFAEPSTVHNSRDVQLTGVAYNISRLWLNDRPIYTDAQGNFKEALILENGYTVATLRAEDRYGRETTIERTFVYTPSSFIQ